MSTQITRCKKCKGIVSVAYDSGIVGRLSVDEKHCHYCESVSDLQRANAELVEENARLAKEAELCIQFSHSAAYYQKEAARWQGHHDALKADNQKLRGEYAELHEDFKDARKDLAEALANYKAMYEDCVDVTKALRLVETDRDTLKSLLENATSHSDTLERMIAKLREALDATPTRADHDKCYDELVEALYQLDKMKRTAEHWMAEATKFRGRVMPEPLAKFLTKYDGANADAVRGMRESAELIFRIGDAGPFTLYAKALVALADCIEWCNESPMPEGCAPREAVDEEVPNIATKTVTVTSNLGHSHTFTPSKRFFRVCGSGDTVYMDESDTEDMVDGEGSDPDVVVNVHFSRKDP